jgi:hypothetical protein
VESGILETAQANPERSSATEVCDWHAHQSQRREKQEALGKVERGLRVRAAVRKEHLK